MEFIPSVTLRSRLVESGIIFMQIRWMCFAQLSFGDFKIRRFAGGIRITDRNGAIAFVMALHPHPQSAAVATIDVHTSSRTAHVIRDWKPREARRSREDNW